MIIPLSSINDPTSVLRIHLLSLELIFHALFSQTNHGSRNIDCDLDIAQLELLSYFYMQKKPIMGICKDIQLINIFQGGTIIQDLATASLQTQKNEQDNIHQVHSIRSSLFDTLWGSSFYVNSSHHQGLDHLGKSKAVVNHIQFCFYYWQ